RKATYQRKDRSRGGSVSHRVLLSDMGTRARMGATRKRAPATATAYIAAFMPRGLAAGPEHPLESEQTGGGDQAGDGGDQEHEGEGRGQGPVERLAHVGLDQNGDQGHLAPTEGRGRDKDPQADHEEERGPRRDPGQAEGQAHPPEGLSGGGAEVGGGAEEGGIDPPHD